MSNDWKALVEISVEDVARLLRSFRRSKGLTQTAVATELGISQSNLSKMENAQLQPSAIQWMSFCQLVGVSPNILILEKKRSKSS